MKLINKLLLLLLVCSSQIVIGQPAFDAAKFFTDEAVLNVTLNTDIRILTREKEKTDEQKATFTVTLPDGTTVSEGISINARGRMRRTVCKIPPLRLNFKNPTSPRLASLKSLKLVNSCRPGNSDVQLLLKEYLAYKMFNLFTEKSFRVRLINATYEDSRDNKKASTTYAFFIEDVDAMAKRNGCKELNNMRLSSTTTDREQMTLVGIFQYMIGNTDWSVPNNHNIKLMIPKNTTTVRPFVVPYDFDYAGLINADYAAPDPIMEIETVTQRVYRGFPRTMAELQPVIQLFMQQKENIYALVNNLEPLSNGNKKEITYYLDDFYKMINNEKRVQSEFIDNARER